METITTRHGLTFAIYGQGWGRYGAEADYDRAVKAVTTRLNRLSAKAAREMHAAMLASVEGEANYPERAAQIVAEAEAIAKRRWHDPEGGGDLFLSAEPARKPEMKIFATTAGNRFFYMDLRVLAADADDARAKFQAFIDSHEYADEEREGGVYTLGRVSEEDYPPQGLGTPSEDVQMARSGMNG